MPYVQAYPTPASTSPPPLETLTAKQLSLSSQSSGSSTRYVPYPSPLSPRPFGSFGSHSSSSVDHRRGSGSSISDDIRLPPLVVPDRHSTERRSSVSLPPISALDSQRYRPCDDSAAVLRRLQMLDDDDVRRPSSSLPPITISCSRSGPPQMSASRLLSS